MKTVINLIKTELRVLFCSPISWLILIIFAIQVGLEVTERFDIELKRQLMGYLSSNRSITMDIFSGKSGVITSLLGKLYLYIPLLTMGLVSRELNSGSIKLLNSSPIHNAQIILGKYFSVLIYFLFFILILITSIIFASWGIPNIDIGMLWVALLGFYLTICAYAAIGLFMSTITNYQVVAAMGTLIILALLNYVNQIGQDYEIIRNITFWLSIKGRSNVFLEGLISTQDIAYFLTIISLFIYLSIFRLDNMLTSYSIKDKAIKYVSILVATFTIGYITSRPLFIKYYDGTKTKANTLSNESQIILSKLDGDLSMISYSNILSRDYVFYSPKTVNYQEKRHAQYLRFKPNMKLKYKYYYHHNDNNKNFNEKYAHLSSEEKKNMACKLTRNTNTEMFINGKQLMDEDNIDLSTEDFSFFRVFEYNNKRAVLRVFSDSQREPSEIEKTTALKTLITNSPTVAFINGHGERNIYSNNDKDYKPFSVQSDFRYALVNRGFKVTHTDLSSKVDPNINIIVISDMRTGYNETELSHFYEFVDRGGNIIILGEVNRQKNMNPLLHKLGLKFTDNILVQTNKNNVPNLVYGVVTEDGAKKFKYLRSYKNRAAIKMPTTLGIETISDCGFKNMDIVVSLGKDVWNETSSSNLISEKPTLNPELEEVEKSYSLVKYLTKNVNGKEQRIFVVGDSDCFCKEEMRIENGVIKSNNFTLLTTMFRDLAYNEFPIEAYRPSIPDNTIKISKSVLNIGKVVLIWLIPLSLLISFIFLFLKRRGN